MRSLSMNRVAADVSPLILFLHGRQSRLTSAATKRKEFRGAQGAVVRGVFSRRVGVRERPLFLLMHWLLMRDFVVAALVSAARGVGLKCNPEAPMIRWLDTRHGADGASAHGPEGHSA